MSEQRSKDGIRISQVLASALAAVTAALLGSTMGIAGTIIGAGLASVVTTVGGALYLRSIQRTSESVRVVTAKVVGRSGDATVLVSKDHAETGEEVAADTEEATDSAETTDASEASEASETSKASDAPPTGKGRLRWTMVVAGSLVAFVLGMLLVTGVEWVRGEPLSGGEGTTLGNVVEQRQGDTSETPKPSDQPTTTTPPADDPSRPNPPPTTPPTESSPTESQPPTTTTTVEAPATTTTVEPNLPGGTLPPSQ